MRVTRRISIGIVLVLVAAWLSIAWLADSMSPSSRLPQLTIRCDGGPGEREFLAEEKHAELEQGFRRLTSGDGFIVYRIPTGGARLERVSYCVNQVACRLEYSLDGRAWHTLVRLSFADANGDKFSVQSSGFPADVKPESAHRGVAYFRLSASGSQRGAYPAIRSLTLTVSGFPTPAYFSRATWNTRVHALLALLGPKLMILVGVGAVFFGRKNWRTPWSLFAAGALLWAVSVAAKAGFALLLNGPVYQLLHTTLPSVPANVVFWCYIGSLTGLFECGIFLLVVKPIRKQAWDWKKAASLGVGFGAIEAVALGSAAALAAALSSEPTVDLRAASSLIGPVERALALAVHLAAVVTVIYAITQRQWRWFAASFIFKSGVDAVAAFALLTGIVKSHPWCVELFLVGPFALVGIIVVTVLARSWRDVAADPQTGERAVAPGPVETPV
jgi:uncharacterized membrane protein YhfC